MMVETDSVAALSEGEKEVLRIYLETSSSKEIAARIGRSHHEVERRFKAARGKLGVSRTQQAARMLAFAEQNPTYQAAVYQDLVGRSADRIELIMPPSDTGGVLASLPVPRKGRPWNAYPLRSRLLAVTGGALLIIALAILSVSFAQALSAVARTIGLTERQSHDGIFTDRGHS